MARAKCSGFFYLTTSRSFDIIEKNFREVFTVLENFEPPNETLQAEENQPAENPNPDDAENLAGEITEGVFYALTDILESIFSD